MVDKEAGFLATNLSPAVALHFMAGSEHVLVLQRNRSFVLQVVVWSGE
jgi:hypothetical protein